MIQIVYTVMMAMAAVILFHPFPVADVRSICKNHLVPPEVASCNLAGGLYEAASCASRESMQKNPMFS